MKILICTTEYPPIGTGIANGVFYLRKEFMGKSHKVDILSPIGPDIKVGSAKAWKKVGGLAILDFWNKTQNIIFEKIKNYDVVLCRNPLFTKPTFHPKIICSTHTTYTGRWEHQYFKNPIKALYYKYMTIREKQAYKYMHNLPFITLTEKIAKEIDDLGITAKTRIPNGIDTEKFKVETNKREQACAATRLVPWKRVDLLVQYFNKLGYKLKIAGDGPLLNKLKKHAKQNIEFLGKLSKEDLIKLYQESKVYVSTSEYEGLPNTLLESMSCGCIPIVSDIPGHMEVMHKMQDETNPMKIHQFIKKHYDWSIIADQYLEVFKNV